MKKDRAIFNADTTLRIEKRMMATLRELRLVELRILRQRFSDEPKALEQIDLVIREKELERCEHCGFHFGQRVTMRSALVGAGDVYGKVDTFTGGCGHVVLWDDMPTATALPNPNVRAWP